MKKIFLLLTLLLSSLNLLGRNLSENSRTGERILEGEDHSKEDLSGANLYLAHLEGKDFSGANLTQASCDGDTKLPSNYECNFYRIKKNKIT